MNAVATPAFSPDGGAHPGGSVTVAITCATAGATIRYTTDGSEPAGSSALVPTDGRVSFPLPGRLKARAWKDGMNPSAVKSAEYTRKRTIANDYSGDGNSDLAVFCQNTGWWYIITLDGELIAWELDWGWPGAWPVGE